MDHPETSRELGRGRRSGTLALLSLLATGCSISLPLADGKAESLVGYLLRSDHDGTYRRLTPGIDIRFAGAWPGASVGYSDLTILDGEEPPEGPQGHEVGANDDVTWDYAPPLGWLRRETSGKREWFGWFVLHDDDRPERAGPQFVHHLSVGAGVRTSEDARGLQIGWSRAALTRLPHEARDVGSAVLIEFSSDDPSRARLIEITGEME